VVAWPGWLAIEAAERALGGMLGRDTVKIPERADLLAAARTRA
jgi:ferredoxin--NADP+ reductase